MNPTLTFISWAILAFSSTQAQQAEERRHENVSPKSVVQPSALTRQFVVFESSAAKTMQPNRKMLESEEFKKLPAQIIYIDVSKNRDALKIPVILGHPSVPSIFEVKDGKFIFQGNLLSLTDWKRILSGK